MGNSESGFRKYQIPSNFVSMREGACKETFIAWRDNSTEENFVRMRKCMEAHSNYYQPVLAASIAGDNVLMKELESFLLPLNEDSNQSEEEKEVELMLRFCEFMKGGDCKEIFTAFEDCMVEDDESSRCLQVKRMMLKCAKAHPDYYQPYLSALKAAGEQTSKVLEALFPK